MARVWSRSMPPLAGSSPPPAADPPSTPCPDGGLTGPRALLRHLEADRSTSPVGFSHGRPAHRVAAEETEMKKALVIAAAIVLPGGLPLLALALWRSWHRASTGPAGPGSLIAHG